MRLRTARTRPTSIEDRRAMAYLAGSTAADIAASDHVGADSVRASIDGYIRKATTRIAYYETPGSDLPDDWTWHESEWWPQGWYVNAEGDRRRNVAYAVRVLAVPA